VAKPASDTSLSANPPQDLYPHSLFPTIEANKSGLLPVGDEHEIYWEEVGNQDGIPALFLHGGPGGGCGARSRRFFDPDIFRIICLDQRGCGRSIPNASSDWQKSIHENNTVSWGEVQNDASLPLFATPHPTFHRSRCSLQAKLVEDLEKLRSMLGIEKWGVVLGGSWGSTLTLAYAEAHPKVISDIVLRGVFLFTPNEVDYLFQNGGTSSQNPEAWDMYTKYIQDTSEDFNAESTNFLGAYYKRMSSDDDEVRRAAASAFVGYELSISKVRKNKVECDGFSSNGTHVCLTASCNFMTNSFFLST
jgi:proline iminopeptidase